MTGAIEPLPPGLLSFEPYGSRIVVFRTDGRAGSWRPASRRAIESIEMRTGWTVTVNGTPTETDVYVPHSWTDKQESRFTSGTGSYARSVEVPAAFRATGVRVFLDFGSGVAVQREALLGGTMRGNSFAALVAPPILEAGTIFINNRRAGTIWAPPYRVDVTNYLRNGANDIRIDVYNTAINRLAEGGHLPNVDALVERYGQRFRLQDLDNLRPIPSGIQSIPRLVAER